MKSLIVFRDSYDGGEFLQLYIGNWE